MKNNNQDKIFNIMLSKGLGGIEQAFIDYSKAILKSGRIVVCIIRQNALIKNQLMELKKHSDNVEIIEISNYSKLDFLSRIKSKKTILDHKPKAIICHGNRAISAFRKAAKKYKIATIGVAHNYSLKNLVKCDYIFSITEDLRKNIIEFGFNGEKIFVVPNMIDLPYDFSAISEDNIDSFKNPVKIGVMARFVKKKGVDIFIKSLSALIANNNNFKALIAGNGEEMEELQKLRDEVNVKDEIEFIGWVKDKDEFYRDIDIFCLPSLHEPFGIVILEAMKAGKPIVSTNSEGPNEILESEKDAIIVEKGHAGEMSVALDRMLKEKAEFRFNLARNAQLKLIERYSLSAVSKRISDLLEDIEKDFKLRS
jgi:glycosyltransferase involved in cell wall biosynthesis